MQRPGLYIFVFVSEVTLTLCDQNFKVKMICFRPTNSALFFFTGFPVTENQTGQWVGEKCETNDENIANLVFV